MHPNEFRIEALRGRQVRLLDPRWAPRGARDVVYETLSERERTLVDKRYAKAVDAADGIRRTFPDASAETVQDLVLTIDRKVWTKMEILPNFAARYLENDLAFLHRAATQIAIGEGAISICREFQDLERMMLVDEAYEEYLCEFPRQSRESWDEG